MTADGADGVVDDDDENLAPVVSENATTRDARDDVAMTVKSAMGRSVVSFSRAFVNPVARRPFVSPMVGKPPTTGVRRRTGETGGGDGGEIDGGDGEIDDGRRCGEGGVRVFVRQA